MSKLVSDTVDPDRSRDVDTVASNNVREVYKKGITGLEVASFYDKWAENGVYDTFVNTGLDVLRKTPALFQAQLSPERYSGPENTAQRVAQYFAGKGKQDVRILDVAAGTGRLGAELFRQGFRTIEALDPSEGMLKKAKQKGVYINYIQDFIGGDNKVPADDDYYDCVATCGGFGEGHVPASAMEEMVRIVRPGGLVCICTREEFLPRTPEYQQTMAKLIHEGKWKLKASEVIDNYFLDKTGAVYQYIVI